MNYTNIYNKLIQRAVNRTLVGYTETHHILPKCLGGTDAEDNLVELTPEEHYIAHQLLVKIYPENNSVIHAAVMMTVKSETNNIRSNKLYGWLRRKHAVAISKNQSGSGNSQFGKYWICNTTTGEVMRTTSKEIPEGWHRGKTQYTTCEICGKNSGSKQRRFCFEHRPKSIAPKSSMAKGSPAALKLTAYCKARTTEEHPQYGKRWVNDGTVNKMIPKDQVDTFLADGWIKGKLPRPS